MFKAFLYEYRNDIKERVTALIIAAVAFLGMFFKNFLPGFTGVFEDGSIYGIYFIVFVVLVGYVSIFPIISAIALAARFYSKEKGYLYLTVPLKGWQQLLARGMVIAADLAIFTPIAFGLSGLMTNNMGLGLFMDSQSLVMSGFGSIIVNYLVNFICTASIVGLIIVIAKSIMFSRKYVVVLIVITAVVLVNVNSLLDMLFAFITDPSSVSIEGLAINYTLNLFDPLTVAIFAVYFAAKIFGIFMLSSHLLERKINI